MKEDKNKSFAADVMLGSLARWLRILGFDTFYSNTAYDNQLQEIVWRENRILLSRDTKLLEGIHTNQRLYIQSKKLPEQLKQVVEYFNLSENIQLFSRCCLCNVAVRQIEKIMVNQKVAEFVYDNYDEFWTCPSCKQIFWPGTHRNLAIEWLAKHEVVCIEK